MSEYTQPPITIVNQTLPAKHDEDEDDENELSFRDIWYLCAGHWHWFILSIVLCLGIAVFYLLSTPKVYQRTAAIMLNEGGKLRSNEGEEIDDFGLFQTKSSVQNEIIAFTSPTLMQDVALQMHTEVNYWADGLFHDELLYGKDLPLNTLFPDLGDSQTASCKVSLSADGTLRLTDFTYNGQKQDGVFTSRLFTSSLEADTILDTPAGQIILLPTPYYAKGQTAEFRVERGTIREAIQFVNKHFTAASRGKDNSVIDLTFEDVSTHRAEDILATIIALYNKKWVQDRNQIAVATTRFIGERLNVIEQELGDVESNISEFKSDNLLPDANAAASMYMNQAQNATQQIAQLSNQLYMSRYIKQYVLDPSNQDQLLPANAGIQGANVNSIIAQYNAKQLQRNNLLANSSANNPVIQDLSAQVNELRSNLIASVDNEILSLQTQINSFRRAQSQSTAQLADNPNKQQYLLSVERQQKVKESLYLFLLQKREENELSQAFTAYNTRVITSPTGSDDPKAPDSQKILLIAFLVGVVIPISILLLRELLNTKVRGRLDLEKLTVPVVGELPEMPILQNGKKNEHRKLRTLVVKPGERDVINESFRIVRANLSYMVGPQSNAKAKVILVSSLNPCSGKTFISANLAAAFAIQHSKVALVDLDLRKCSTSHFLSHIQTGLTDYLNQREEDWHKIIHPLTVGDGTESLSIDMIPVGHRVPNPSELLQSPLLKEMIDGLKAEYDYILLDCPPAQIVADVGVVKPLAELTLFIVRVGVMERSGLKVIEQFYKDKTYNNLAVLLNGAELHKGKYGSYRYGYGYGYNYSYDYEYSK